jgi:hypothetical protein
MQVPPISWLPLRMVTFIGAQFGRTLSRFDGTAPHAIQPLYATPIIVAPLNVLFYIQKHGREIYSFQKIAVGNTPQIEGGALAAGRS